MKSKKPEIMMIADRRERLLTAARSLIDSGDAELVSMRRLAAETGTSPATAYAIFGSKSGLLVELLQEDRLRFQEKVARLRSASPIDKIFRAISAAIDIYRSNPKFHIYIMQQYFSTSGDEIRSFIDPRRHSLWFPLVDEFCCGEDRLGLSSEIVTSHLEDIYIACLSHWALSRRSIDFLEAELGLGFAIALRGITAKPDDAYFGKKLRKYRRLLAKSVKSERRAAE
jgi:AcrR family transcriptional regulator